MGHGVPDLETIPAHSDDQGEGSPSRKWRVVVSLFGAPAAVLEAVQNHVRWEAIVARVEMQCYVCVLHRTTLQIHMEPEKETKIQERNTSSTIYRINCFFMQNVSNVAKM